MCTTSKRLAFAASTRCKYLEIVMSLSLLQYWLVWKETIGSSFSSIYLQPFVWITLPNTLQLIASSVEYIVTMLNAHFVRNAYDKSPWSCAKLKLKICGRAAPESATKGYLFISSVTLQWPRSSAAMSSLALYGMQLLYHMAKCIL